MNESEYIALFWLCCLAIGITLHYCLTPIIRTLTLGPTTLPKDNMTNIDPPSVRPFVPYRAQIGDRVLATCDNYFVAPNGQLYRAVFGTLHAVSSAEDTLGIKPNGKSTNWYLQIGDMTIAGCQVHYLIKTDKCTFGVVPTQNLQNGEMVTSLMTTSVYNADEEA